MTNDLTKAAALAGGAALIWKLKKTKDEFTWKGLTESGGYQTWLGLCTSLVDNGWVPTYQPEDENGNRVPIPSRTLVPKAPIPETVEDCQVLQPLTLRGLTLRNRVIRAAAFDGESEADMIKTHTEQAIGGVGLTTVAYCCVNKNGLSFKEQLVMEEARRDFLCRLTSEVHSAGQGEGKICAQLTHGGSFADRDTIGCQQQAPSVVFNPAGFDFPREMSLADCENMADDFAKAALLAKETGFDAVELHCGHGYLLSQFLSPDSNKRTDKYGGSAEGRAEFPVECLRRCREVVGNDFPIIVKLNVSDGFYGGLELRDATVAAHKLADNSADLLVITCGFVSKNGFFMLRGNTPQEKLVQALPGLWKKLACAMFGPLAVPSVPYQDTFLRDSARHILKEVGHKTKVCLMGGVNDLSEMEGAMAEGFGAVQIARALIREPDLVNRIQATLELQQEGKIPQVDNVVSNCIRCNMCVIATVDPTAAFGCPFQKMDARRRQAQGEEIFSVATMRKGILDEHGVSMNPVLANRDRDLRDIEDLVHVTSQNNGKL